ncbi:hypothetical protein A616_08140 [Brevibacillus brevis X23]|nr:hypothetical protein A616_08140 [Brevibacillus brevis X23]
MLSQLFWIQFHRRRSAIRACGHASYFVVYGRKTGAIAGALGMGLFDLISGWTAWASHFIACTQWYG